MKLNLIKKRSGNVVTSLSSGNQITANLIKSINALSADLAIIIDEINNKINPALNGGALGEDDEYSTTEDIYLDGISGKNLYVDRNANSNSAPWLYQETKPLTIKESLAQLHSIMLSTLSSYETQETELTDYIKNYIGLKAFDSTQTSDTNSMDGRIDTVLASTDALNGLINENLPYLKDLSSNKFLFTNGTKTPAILDNITWDPLLNTLNVNGHIKFDNGLQSSGGDERGNDHCVDLQTDRDLDGQVAYGLNSNVLGGKNNRAAGDYSTCTGGYGNSSITDYSRTGGTGSMSLMPAEDAWSSGSIIEAGDSQVGRLSGRIMTTTNAPTPLNFGTYPYLPIEVNSAHLFDIKVIGRRPSDNQIYTYTFAAAVVRQDAAVTTTLKLNGKNVLYEDDAAADCNISVDTVSGGLIITVTAPSATQVNWTAGVNYTKAK